MTKEQMYAVWADGTLIEIEDIEEMTYMSDDYAVVPESKLEQFIDLNVEGDN